MGASIKSGGGGGGRRKRSGRGAHVPMSEINVTPFVDVMLVLLIIFMVTAPLLTAGVPLELPQTGGKQLAAAKEPPVTVSVRADGRIYLQEAEVSAEQLVPKLLGIAKAGYAEPIYIRGDKSIDYATFMKVMGRISQAGFKKLSLVTDVSEGQ